MSSRLIKDSDNNWYMIPKSKVDDFRLFDKNGRWDSILLCFSRYKIDPEGVVVNSWEQVKSE